MTAGAIGLSMGLYTYYQIPPSPYPEAVTKHIRKALYYEGAGNDPRQAIQCYLQALEEATVAGLDQTSDNLTGLKIKIGAVYESSGRLDSAIRVYSGLLNEIQGAINREQVSVDDRTRLLRRAIGTSVKVGDLSMQVPAYRNKAEPCYTWALETMLKETGRRKGDTTWLEQETIGGLYETVASFYYADNRPHLALPLYLRSLDASDKVSCHTITIMNNIASSISSQNSALQVQENAAQWAIRARDLKVLAAEGEEQSECDLGRCSAFYNLGMIAEKRLALEEALDHYKAALKRSQALRTSEGRDIEKMTRQGLDRVSKRVG